jgi:hypothetical protein
VQEAVRGGARLLCGGNRKGSLFEPTVSHRHQAHMKVNCQEIFAPVVTVEPYNDFASALKQVNSSAYGLQAGLFTRDAKLIFQAYDELEVGGLIAGDVPTFRIDHMPYGGVKDSGLGTRGLARCDSGDDGTETAGHEFALSVSTASLEAKIVWERLAYKLKSVETTKSTPQKISWKKKAAATCSNSPSTVILTCFSVLRHSEYVT